MSFPDSDLAKTFNRFWQQFLPEFLEERKKLYSSTVNTFSHFCFQKGFLYQELRATFQWGY